MNQGARPKSSLKRLTDTKNQNILKNPAFIKKSEEQLEKLLSAISETLVSNILSLLDSDENCDLILSNGKDEVKAHRNFFKYRCKKYWSDQWEKEETEGDTKQMYRISMHGCSKYEIESFLRQLYTVNDPEHLMKQFIPILNKSINSIHQDQRNSDECVHASKDYQVNRTTNEVTGVTKESVSEENVNVLDCYPVENDLHEQHSEETSVQKQLSDLEDDQTNLSTQKELDSETFICPYISCSNLGRDLLSMYLQQIDCDCCLLVDGSPFYVHTFILAARSEYFSLMFSDRWRETSTEAIILKGVTDAAFEQFLLFLYGGVIEIMSTVDLTDLFRLVDMYTFDSLKPVLSFLLTKEFCHFFHKPCRNCQQSAPEAVYICYNFNLSDLLSRIVKWIGKNFAKIWPTKQFSMLPEQVQQVCLDGIVSQMTETNVIDIIVECNRLIVSLPRVKWTEPVLCLITQLMDKSIEFTSQNCLEIIRTDSFMSWGHVASWKVTVLEEIFHSVIDSFDSDTACNVYQELKLIRRQRLLLELDEDHALDLLNLMINRCERFMRIHIHQVAACEAWTKINQDTKDDILKGSSFVSLDSFPGKKPKPCKPNRDQRFPLREKPTSDTSTTSIKTSVKKTVSSNLSSLKKKILNNLQNPKISKTKDLSANPRVQINGKLKKETSSLKSVKIEQGCCENVDPNKKIQPDLIESTYYDDSPNKSSTLLNQCAGTSEPNSNEDSDRPKLSRRYLGIDSNTLALEQSVGDPSSQSSPNSAENYLKVSNSESNQSNQQHEALTSVCADEQDEGVSNSKSIGCTETTNEDSFDSSDNNITLTVQVKITLQNSDIKTIQLVRQDHL